MELSASAQERALRSEVAAFLEEHKSTFDDVPRELAARLKHLRAWQKTCYDAGFVGRSWPTDVGGRGAPAGEQVLVDEEFAIAGAPPFASVIGLSVLGPALVEFATPDQKARYLPPVLAADEIWCQGFSEPEAGSDLGSLRTVAVEDGDYYVVNGQKTWTSWAQFADWCGLLARTDAEAPKHKGISMLIVDMRLPGVTVRPVEQISGHAEFCEVFFHNVRVPKSQLLGAPGQGWSIAMHAFGHERGTSALRAQIRLSSAFDHLVGAVRERLATDIDPARMAEVECTLAKSLIDIEVLRQHTFRMVGGALNGKEVGAESSTVKLLRNRTEQNLYVRAMDLLSTSLAADDKPEAALAWYDSYLQSRPVSVFGGTEQVQRNIIANRILNLPKS
jgi:alkylation response protein AidB-like acyl-CoA dehydrogenase